MCECMCVFFLIFFFYIKACIAGTHVVDVIQMENMPFYRSGQKYTGGNLKTTGMT